MLGCYLPSGDELLVGYALAATMYRKAHDNVATLHTAELARCARHVITLGCGADHDAPTARRLHVSASIGRQHSDNGRDAHVCKLVRLGQAIGTQVDGEPVKVCALDVLSVAVAMRLLMRVRESALALVRLRDVVEMPAIDALAFTRQITADVVTPDLTLRQCAYLLGQFNQRAASRAIGYLAPVHRLRSAFRVARLEHGAARRACIVAGRGRGDWASLGVC